MKTIFESHLENHYNFMISILLKKLNINKIFEDDNKLFNYLLENKLLTKYKCTYFIEIDNYVYIFNYIYFNKIKYYYLFEIHYNNNNILFANRFDYDKSLSIITVLKNDNVTIIYSIKNNLIYRDFIINDYFNENYFHKNDYLYDDLNYNLSPKKKLSYKIGYTNYYNSYSFKDYNTLLNKINKLSNNLKLRKYKIYIIYLYNNKYLNIKEIKELMNILNNKLLSYSL